MKYIYLSLIILLTACNVFAQTHNFKAVFDYNPAKEQVIKYNLYIINMEDTLNCPLVDSMVIHSDSPYYYGTLTTQQLKAIDADTARFPFISKLDGNYIRAGVTAINSSTQNNGESFLAVSAFYLKEYAIMPSKVGIVKIR